MVTQTKNTEIKDLIEIFNELDVNQDGFLTNKEFVEGLKSKNQSVQELALFFKQMDFDRSGKISYTEFISAQISKEIYLNESKLK